MTKNVKILIAGLAAAVLVGGVTVPIMAADSPTPSATVKFAVKDDLMAKTAAILGISTDTLTNAFKQVQPEIKTALPMVDDYHTRIANILGISVETLTNAEKQAMEEVRNATPTPSKRPMERGKFVPADLTERIAKILGITADKLTAAEKQAREEFAAEFKTKTPTPPTAPAKDEMLAKVAQVLGITTEKLQDAMQQAAKEIEQANLDASFANAVTNGTVTQAEADQIKAWLAQRPAALDKLPGFGGMFGGKMMGPGFSGGLPGIGPQFRIEKGPEFGPKFGPEFGLGRGPEFGKPGNCPVCPPSTTATPSN